MGGCDIAGGGSMDGPPGHSLWLCSSTYMCIAEEEEEAPSVRIGIGYMGLCCVTEITLGCRDLSRFSQWPKCFWGSPTKLEWRSHLMCVCTTSCYCCFCRSFARCCFVRQHDVALSDSGSRAQETNRFLWFGSCVCVPGADYVIPIIPISLERAESAIRTKLRGKLIKCSGF